MMSGQSIDEKNDWHDAASTTSVHDKGGSKQNDKFTEEEEKQRELWEQQLIKAEEEILTLRQVLNVKIKEAHDLKKKLGITVWKEFQDDMSQGLQNVRDSQVYKEVEEKMHEFGEAVSCSPIYQKTSEALKTTAEKTQTVLGGIGSTISAKLSDIKNTNAFKSFEEKIGTATTMGNSRSTSATSFDEALKQADNVHSSSKSSTMCIPEGKTSP